MTSSTRSKCRYTDTSQCQHCPGSARRVTPCPTPQMIRQLENNIEKMHMKIHAGQKVTALYLALRDVLKRVRSPPCDGGCSVAGI